MKIKRIEVVKVILQTIRKLFCKTLNNHLIVIMIYQIKNKAKSQRGHYHVKKMIQPYFQETIFK
jgi:hypothetical protein